MDKYKPRKSSDLPNVPYVLKRPPNSLLEVDSEPTSLNLQGKPTLSEVAFVVKMAGS